MFVEFKSELQNAKMPAGSETAMPRERYDIIVTFLSLLLRCYDRAMIPSLIASPRKYCRISCETRRQRQRRDTAEYCGAVARRGCALQLLYEHQVSSFAFYCTIVVADGFLMRYVGKCALRLQLGYMHEQRPSELA